MCTQCFPRILKRPERIGKLLFFVHATVGEALSLPRSTGFQLLTRMGEFVPVYHICTIQPNTQLTNLAGGYEPPLQWRVRFLPAKQQFAELLI